MLRNVPNSHITSDAGKMNFSCNFLLHQKQEKGKRNNKLKLWIFPSFSYCFSVLFATLIHKISSPHRTKKKGRKIKSKFSLRREKSSRLIAKAAKTFPIFFFFHFELIQWANDFQLSSRFVFFHKNSLFFPHLKGWNFFHSAENRNFYVHALERLNENWKFSLSFKTSSR